MGRLQLLLFGVALLVGVWITASDNADPHRAIAIKIPPAISLQTFASTGVSVGLTLPWSGPARFVVRETVAMSRLHAWVMRFALGAGGVVAVLPYATAWGTCGSLELEVEILGAPLRFLGDIVILSPWSPNTGSVVLIAEAGLQLDF